MHGDGKLVSCSLGCKCLVRCCTGAQWSNRRACSWLYDFQVACMACVVLVTCCGDVGRQCSPNRRRLTKQHGRCFHMLSALFCCCCCRICMAGVMMSVMCQHLSGAAGSGGFAPAVRDQPGSRQHRTCRICLAASGHGGPAESPFWK